MPDLLVIGAGLAGLTAATTAAKAGLRVKVVAKGLGALHWDAGTLDLLGYMNGKEVARPLPAIAQLPENHPYRLAGDVAGALVEFAALTEEIGLPYRRVLGHGLTRNDTEGENLWLPSPVGAGRPAFLAPQGQQAGSLRSEQPMLIVGFDGLRDFYPQLIAENLGKQGHKARAASLPLAVVSDRRDNTAVTLAHQLDQPQARQKLGQALRKLVKPGERIGLPAVLGLENHAQVLADLQAAAGTAVFEIPTLPPSIPGMRLFRALRRKLEEMGVRVEVGMEAGKQLTMSNEQLTNNRVEWVFTETSARPLRHRARAFLLATGGVLGGGFVGERDGRLREPIFDLPLTAPSKRRDWFRPAFLDPAGHPVFRGGVAVGPDFRPLDGPANVWAAGGALAHCDLIGERSLSGTAVVSGITAAKEIVKSVTSNQ